MTSVSHPLGVRELKLSPLVHAHYYVGSHPLGVRELKLGILAISAEYLSRTL